MSKMKDEIRDIIKKIIAYHICNDIPKGIDKDKVDEALEQIEVLSSKERVLTREEITTKSREKARLQIDLGTMPFDCNGTICTLNNIIGFKGVEEIATHIKENYTRTKAGGIEKEISVEEIAIFMHDEYEKQAKIVGWNTQDSCKVEFNDLPQKNKQVMRAVAQAIKDKPKGKE